LVVLRISWQATAIGSEAIAASASSNDETVTLRSPTDSGS
jgi:hypothetical protein